MKTTGSKVTKYVYGNGLIGEETNGVFKTYHFDYRARYYSPDMKRFINADVVAGDISNAVTLNRCAYANGNPVSYVDPLGLSADDKDNEAELLATKLAQIHEFLTAGDPMLQEGLSLALFDENMYKTYYEWLKLAIKLEPRPNNIGVGQWAKILDRRLGEHDNMFGKNSKFVKGMDVLGKIGVASDIIGVVVENAQSGADAQGAFTDTVVDIGVVLFEDVVSATVAVELAGIVGSAITGAITGSVAPGVGTLIGAVVGAAGGIYAGNKVDEIFRTENENGKSLTDWMKDSVNWLLDGMPGLLN